MKQFFKQYIPYYKNYKRQFFYALIGMIMVAIGTSGTAYIIKPVLDEIFILGKVSGFHNLAEAMKAWHNDEI